MRITYKLLKNTLIVIMALAIIFLTNGAFEMVIVQEKINNFKERGIYVGADVTLDNTYYYRVPKEYEYEDTTRNIFNQKDRIIGSKTDIIITNRNPMREYPSLSLIVGFLATNFYVGHATINSTDNGRMLIEVVGNSSSPDDNVVIESYNSWLKVEELLGDEGDSPIIIGLRIKNTTQDERDNMIRFAESKMDMPYNYSFLFNRTNSFYCTDLVSRSVKSTGININYDYLATTGNDIIVSRNVYIIFIRETVVKNGIKNYNYYYLE